MNKKLLYLMAIALLTSMQIQAQSTFKYTATVKVEAFDKVENLIGAEAEGYGESTVSAFTYYVGDPTGIKAIENGKLKMENGKWKMDRSYNLQGQRVDNTYKGVVIRNGRIFYQ